MTAVVVLRALVVAVLDLRCRKRAGTGQMHTVQKKKNQAARKA